VTPATQAGSSQRSARCCWKIDEGATNPGCVVRTVTGLSRSPI
jgi:hypothetical protein